MEQCEFPTNSSTLEHTISSADNDRKIIYDELLPMLLKLFSNLNLSWNKTLLSQFQAARITFHDYGSSWFFDFSYKHDVALIAVTQPVPVFVDICTKFIVTGEDVFQLDHDPSAFWLAEQQDSIPGFEPVKDTLNSYISCNLHIRNGVVSEIEVISWNGERINYQTLYSDICYGQRIYRINEPWVATELSKSSQENCSGRDSL